MSSTETPTTGERRTLRAVAIPSEHGGWGLTIEPGLLGVLIAPSWAGVCLAIAALLAFLIRTPVKLVLVDRRRHRWLPRTRIALIVSIVEGVVLATLVGLAFALADDRRFWIALVPIVPLVIVELWYDVRSRSRRLVPELAGALAVAAVAPAILRADGVDARLALAVWLILAARIVGSVCHVRTQIARLHDRPPAANVNLLADAATVGIAIAAVFVDADLAPALTYVIAVIIFQAVRRRRRLWPVAVIGVSQMLIGLGLVIVTAVTV